MYVPQDGHAICGRVFSPQARFGQVIRVGAVAFHWLRRDLVLERDIRRLGTATTTSPLSCVHAMAVFATAADWCCY